ncbi:MAG: flagellar hook-length control protein FliK [Ancalomicrobiaceae bacterium]|nr:flagellar hook-length control protein FliK [Ancalomicrobiaceae bacterium]
MAVDQVSSRVVQATAAAGALGEAGLREGLTFDARVLAVNADNTLRLATRYGTMDLSADALLGGGQTLAQEVTAENLSTLIGVTLKLAVGAKDVAGGRMALKVVGVETQALNASPSNASQTADPEHVVDPAPIIAGEVANAVARQDGLAPVYSLMSRLSEAGGTLPANVATAMQQLGGLAVSGETDVGPEAVRSALASSGLFFEAKLASGAKPAGAALAAGDLKAALFGLKAALDQWIGQQPASPASAQSGAGQPTSGQPASAAQPADVTAASLGTPQAAAPSVRPGAAALDTEALMTVLRPPPSAGSPQAQATPGAGIGQPGTAPAAGVALPAGVLAARPDLATMAALGELLRAAMPLPDGQRGPARMAKGTPSASAARASNLRDVADAQRPPPPQRGLPLKGQAAIPTSPAGSETSVDVAKDLSRKAGDAIARLTLGQYASLPEAQSADARGSRQPAGSSWLFEVPIALKTGVSVAQFEIDRDAPETTANMPDGPNWRVKFAVDVAPLGAVHGRVVLGGGHLAVAIWAEKAASALALSQDTGQLRQALEKAGLTVDEIRLVAGPPPAGPPARAGGFIDRNA